MPGPDLSEFKALSKKRSTGCTVGATVTQLTGQDRVNFQAALRDPEVTHAAIHLWLRGRGIRMAEQTIGRHRRGGCNCDA